MSDQSKMNRRAFLKRSAWTAAGLSLSSLSLPQAWSRNAKPFDFKGHFGMDTGLWTSLLSIALSQGGEWADLFFQYRTHLYLTLEDHKVSKAVTSVDLGLGIRVVNGEEISYAFTEDLDPKSMKATARNVAWMHRLGERQIGEAYRYQAMPSALSYDLQWDWESAALEEPLKMLRSMDEALFQYPDLFKATLSFEASQNHILVVHASGEVSADSQPMTRLYLSTTLDRKGEKQSNVRSLSARAGMDFYTEARLKGLIQETWEKTSILFEAHTPKGGEMPVVLGPGSSGILLHEAMGHGMEADFNRKGISIFSNRIGERVASPEVTIIDSGTIPEARGSLHFDDEGVRGQHTVLVAEGILESYLHDRISAKHYGVKPTGNGRRQSFRYPPLPRMRTTYMDNGPHEPEEMIGQVSRGIYCESFSNGQVNIGAGDYTFYVKNGYLIENGQLGAPIKDVNIIGNGPESLSRIAMVGNDGKIDVSGWRCGKAGQSVPVSLGIPTVLISAITVGGKA